jgi:putative acetyltransferase
MTIEKYRPEYREQILSVWEESVVATHDFLQDADFQSIKQLVASIDFTLFEVYCLVQQNEVLGFLGISERKLEMLFLSPAYFGKGLGRQLVEFALKEGRVNQVDVNEQNIQAVQFYQKFGFQAIHRQEKDDQGLDYPILKMALPLK